jgi:hypothetical protein
MSKPARIFAGRPSTIRRTNETNVIPVATGAFIRRSVDARWSANS